MHQDAAATHRAEVDIQKSEYEERIAKLALELKLKDRELESQREELKVAHERAFTAETRLGREQALSRELSSQLNQLRYNGAANSAHAAVETHSTHPKPAAAKTTAPAKVRTELDDLDLDLDLDIPDVVLPPSTVTKASASVASHNHHHQPHQHHTASVNHQQAQQNWGDIDDLLDDIQKSGTK